MAALLFTGLPRASDANGDTLSGAKLHFYLTGTTTHQAVYSDSGLTTPLSNPVVADAGGLFPNIYLDPTKVYRAYLTTAAGSVILDTDPVTGSSVDDGSSGSLFTTIQGFVNYLLSSAGSSFIGFIQAGAGAVARTLQSKMREQAFTLEDFGGSTSAGNDATAFQAAMTAAAGHPIDLNGGTYTITATAGGVVIPVTGLDLRNGTLDMSACGGGINPITTAGALGSPVSVTSDVAQYATTVVVSSVSGISAGNKLILTTATDYFSSADSVKMGEWVEVLSVNAGTLTLTLTEPTRYAYTVVGAAKIYKPTTVPFVRLRNVKILGGGDGLAQNGPNLYLVDEVTMDDCSASGFANRGWQYDSCRRITVRGGYCENGDDTTGLSYGHVVSGPTDVASFEDVRGRRLRHVVTGGGTSGVIGTLICDGVYGRQMTDATVDAHPAVDYAVFRNITHYADTSSNNDGDGITCQARDGLVDGLFAPICSRYPVLMQPGCSAYPTCISVKNIYARNYGSYSGSSPVGIYVDLSITGANALTLVHIDAYDIETTNASAYGILINLSSAGANIVRIGTGRVKVTAFGLRVNVASGKVLDYLNVAGSYERTNNSAENVYFAATAAGGVADLKMIGANVKGGQYGVRGANVTAWNVSNNTILGYGTGALLGISDASASQVAKNNYT